MTRNMVFTSAGDHTNFHELWTHPYAKPNYDIFVVYYGDNIQQCEKYKSKVQWIDQHKGSKFQNFLWFYRNHPEILDQYDYFFILDDDLVFWTLDMNQMFSIAREHELAICQPSFLPESIISHKITLQNDTTFLRYTNFVEVTCPLFNKEALMRAMRVMDDSLIGFGIDYLMIWANGMYEKNKYAIVDRIGCVNPTQECKKIARREMYQVLDFDSEKARWETYAEKIGCPLEFPRKTHSFMLL
jgi:hypothetical protein